MQQVLNSNAHCGMILMDVPTAHPRLGVQGSGWDCSPELVLCLHSTARDKAGHRTLGRDRERSVQNPKGAPEHGADVGERVGHGWRASAFPVPAVVVHAQVAAQVVRYLTAGAPLASAPPQTKHALPLPCTYPVCRNHANFGQVQAVCGRAIASNPSLPALPCHGFFSEVKGNAGALLAQTVITA